MRKLAILFSIFLFSCNSSKKIYSDNSFENLYKAEIGGNSEFSFELVHSNDQYLELINRLNLNDIEDEKLLDINFKENDILVTYLGERTTGGYSIEIDEVYWRESILYVKTNEIKPGKGDMVTMVITHPFCISLIPKADKVILK